MYSTPTADATSPTSRGMEPTTGSLVSTSHGRTRMKHHSDQNATLLIASKALQVACSRASPALRDRHSVALCLRHWLRRGVPLVSARSLHLHFRNVQPPVPTEPWYDVGGRRAATGAFRVGRGATVESVPPPPPPPPRFGSAPRRRASHRRVAPSRDERRVRRRPRQRPRAPVVPSREGCGGAATGGAATLGQPAG